ncbi:hypothetical protein [Marinobacter oulmenensis]|uniref:Uncharacterized protein n=1 Tax=Marinobacter oulmenensis TaxID=643747 RepID=A0A840U828_9GAMM|nr:hypothetical protein [Marinobacter oulmenensis]MBB5321864.1 hypothetical protein [Marinobacter oulmenensis]
MVFSGIEFDMDVVRNIDSWGGTLMPPNWLDDVSSGGFKKFNLKVTLNFPVGLSGALTVWLKHQSPEGKERYLGGGGDVCWWRAFSGRSAWPAGSSFRVKGYWGIQYFPPEPSGFSLEVANERSTISHDVDIQAREGKLVATLWYMPDLGPMPREDYIMELSK